MKLHNQVKQQKQIIKTYEGGINDLIRYISSPKFQGADNNYVNPADIILRIREVQADVVFYEQGNGIIE